MVDGPGIRTTVFFKGCNLDCKWCHNPECISFSPQILSYPEKCIGCGRCNFVCPTCTCYTMQDVFYTDNGKVGERRRVGASCMVDGYTNVAGGGQYRRSKGERMRFKVLHKIYDFNEP